MKATSSLTVWIFNRMQATVFAVAGLWGFSSLVGFEPKLIDWFIVPLLVTSVYQWNRLTDFEEDIINYPDDVTAAVRSRVVILWSAILCAGLAIGLSITSSSPAANLFVISIIGLGFLYSTPIPLLGKKKRLKDLFLIKNLSVAVGWSCGMTVYPALNSGSQYRLVELALCAISIFVGAFVMEVICDVRDSAGDRMGGVRSLPVRLGLSRTRAILNAVNLLGSVGLIAAVTMNIVSFLWLLFVVNNIMAWTLTNFLFHRLQEFRLYSHLFILSQIVLAVIMGVVA